MLVFLSPSDQSGNKYAAGNTTEQAQCRRIADFCEKALLEYEGVTVINDQTHTMNERIALSNNSKADVHIPIHTNASTNGTNNGKVGGTRVFYYKEGTEGYKIAQSVFKSLAILTPGTDRLVAYPTLAEVKRTSAPCVYCECEFHDNPAQALWIIENAEKIGTAIADGIAKYFNLKKKQEYKKETLSLLLDTKKYDKIVIELA